MKELTEAFDLLIFNKKQNPLEFLYLVLATRRIFNLCKSLIVKNFRCHIIFFSDDKIKGKLLEYAFNIEEVNHFFNLVLRMEHRDYLYQSRGNYDCFLIMIALDLIIFHLKRLQPNLNQVQHFSESPFNPHHRNYSNIEFIQNVLNLNCSERLHLSRALINGGPPGSFLVSSSGQAGSRSSKESLDLCSPSRRALTSSYREPRTVTSCNKLPHTSIPLSGSHGSTSHASTSYLHHAKVDTRTIAGGTYHSLPPIPSTQIRALDSSQAVTPITIFDSIPDDFLIPPAEIMEILLDLEFRELLDEALAQSITRVDKPYRVRGSKLQVKYISSRDLFEIYLFDESKSYLATKTIGTSKKIKNNVLLFMLKNIPCWDWYLGCAGQSEIVKAYRMVSVSRSSPGFLRRKSIVTFEEKLIREGFMPVEKCLGRADEIVPLFVTPYKGESLVDYKSKGGPITKRFLAKLLNYLLTFFEHNNFMGIWDVKVDNILYYEKYDSFSLVDFANRAYTISHTGALELGVSLGKDPLMTEVHILAHCLVDVICDLLDRNHAKINAFFDEYMLTLIPAQPDHLFYHFFKKILKKHKTGEF